MYSFPFSHSVVIRSCFVEANKLLPHEEVVQERLEKLEQYIVSLKPYVIIPSILACMESMMIVDGHHRYYALLNLGYSSVPVTFIDYQSPLVVPDLEGATSKEALLQAAQFRKLLPPKTSFHHVRDDDFKMQPIILLSTLFKLDVQM